jgi:hypothetical protein
MRRFAGEAWLVAAALGAVYLVWQPVSADLAAQVYRTELFRRLGFEVWNGNWFAGHHLPGYSLLFPPAAALAGPRLVGVLSCVAAAVLFERLAYHRYGPRARLGALWFGAATATNLFTGRLTFALGVAIGLGALLAYQRRRLALSLALAAACPLASPVAGLFLALAALAHAIAARRRDAVAVAAGAFAAGVVLQLLFPERGLEPFVASALWPILAFAAAVVVLAPREERTLRVAAVLYALGATAAFVLPTPMGGNAVRLGTLFGGPVLALVLWRRRTWPLALLAAPLLYWQWSPPVRDVAVATGDPAVRAGYYEPLNHFLSQHAGPGLRVEIPLTRNHWEYVWVARRFPLARGWERQLDVKYNPLFYESRLDPARYRAWLELLGVSYVAVPDARLDYTGIPEARLVRHGVSYLRPVWRSRHWRVYLVQRPRRLVSGAGRLLWSSNAAFAVRARRAGDVLVRVRYTPYWKLVNGTGCVAEAPGGLTRLRLSRPGYVRVAAEFSPVRLLPGDARCGR